MKPKFSIYQYLNFLLTGLIFLGAIIIIFSIDLEQLSLFENISKISFGAETIILFIVLGIVYELGLIINRIGSVLIEPICIRLRLIKYNNDYKMYNDRKKEYPALDTLSREYSLSRTQISLYLILAILSVIKHQWILLAVFLLLAVLFSFSMSKHSKKIVNLMK